MIRNRMHISLLAYVLLSGSIIGFVIGIVGILWVWRTEPGLRESIELGLDLADRTLETSAEGLELVHLSLLRTASTVLLVKGTSEDLSQSLDETIPLLDQMGRLIGDDMVKTLEETQTSIDSAQSSAQLIDDTLRIITAIPIIGRRYNPSMSLAESLASVGESLKEMPASLDKIQSGLTATGERMENIKIAVDTMGEDIRAVEQSLAQAQVVVQEYQNQVIDLQAIMEKVRVRLSNIFLAAKWGATVFFLWLIIAQFGLFIQSRELFQARTMNTEIE